jgi:hypothetical protein
LSLNLKTLAKAAVVVFGVLALVTVIAGKGEATALPQSKCDAAKAEAAGEKAHRMLSCVKRAFKFGAYPSSDCQDRAREEFEHDFDQAEEKDDCTVVDNVDDIECKIDCLVEDITCELADRCWSFSLDSCVSGCME